VDDSSWERVANWGGILFVVMVVVSVVLAGSPPKLTDTPAKIAKYFVDHGDDIKWSGYVGALSTVFLFWWLGSVWRFLRRAEGAVPRLAVAAVAGAVFGAVMAGASGLVSNAIALRGVVGSGGASGTKFFFTLSWVFTAGSTIGISIFVGSIAIVAVRTRVLPVLLGWFGVLVAIVGLVSAASMASDSDALMVLTLVTLIGFLLFVLVTAIVMLRTTGAPAPEGHPAASPSVA
jgi:hypothetical protein